MNLFKFWGNSHGNIKMTSANVSKKLGKNGLMKITLSFKKK